MSDKNIVDRLNDLREWAVLDKSEWIVEIAEEAIMTLTESFETATVANSNTRRILILQNEGLTKVQEVLDIMVARNRKLLGDIKDG
jgi:hypothetical protein